MYFIVIMFVTAIRCIRTDIGSDISGSAQCPMKCDMLQEIQLLRQLVNQETLLRMKMEDKIQDLQKHADALQHGQDGLNKSAWNLSQAVNETLESKTSELWNVVSRVEMSLTGIREREQQSDDQLTEIVAKVNHLSDSVRNVLSGQNNEYELTIQRLQKVEEEIKTKNNSSYVAEANVVEDQECSDLKNSNPNAKSGVYTLRLVNHGPFEAYCDMTTDGGGWTVFQRRMDGSVDFRRNWNAYKTGFGDLSTEFWLGNDLLHALTENGSYHLRVDMETFSGEKVYAKYSTFQVGDEENGYNLIVRGYSGTAGDALSIVDGARFSTADKDLDTSWYWNCAEYTSSPFWYYTGARALTTPNGRYIKKGRYRPRRRYFGITWDPFKGRSMSFKRFSMMIKHV